MRATAEEKLAWAAIAERKGLTLSEWLRALANVARDNGRGVALSEGDQREQEAQGDGSASARSSASVASDARSREAKSTMLPSPSESAPSGKRTFEPDFKPAKAEKKRR